MKILNQFLILGTFYLGRITAEDPCSLVQQPQVYKIDQALQCLRNIQVPKESSEKVLSILKTVAQEYYVFADQTPASTVGFLESPSNISTIFQELESQTFQSDYDFQMELFRKIFSLRDGHFVYTPNCYLDTFVFWNGFPLMAVQDTAKLKFIIIDENSYLKNYVEFMKENYDLDILKFSGAEVLEIDGADPAIVLKDFSDHEFPVTRDASARFNMLLARYRFNPDKKLTPGSWVLSYAPPRKLSHDYQLKLTNGDIVNVTVPVVAINNGDVPFSNTEELTSRCLLNDSNDSAPHSPQASAFSTFKPSSEFSKYLLSSKQNYEPTVSPPEDSPCSSNDDAILFNDVLRFYVLQNNIGVLKISTFFTGSKFVETVLLFEEGIVEFKNRGIQKLIIDVSDNGGGDVPFAYLLINYFFPDPKFNLYQSDFKYNSLFSSLANRAANDPVPLTLWSPSLWLDPSTRRPFTNSTWMDPPLSRRIDGTSIEFSKRIMLNYPIFVPEFKFTPNPFSSKNIILLTNGICFSACSLFQRTFQERYGVKTIGYGGLPSEPLSGSGMFIGLVENYDNLRADAGYYGLNDVLEPLPVLAEISFTIKESFSDNNRNRPLEFDFIDVNSRLFPQLDDVCDIKALWEKVSKDPFVFR